MNIPKAKVENARILEGDLAVKTGICVGGAVEVCFEQE